MSYFDFDNKRIYYTIEGSGKPLLALLMQIRKQWLLMLRQSDHSSINP